jgi:hypothetical protein
MNIKGKKDNLSNAGKGRPRGCKNKFTSLKDSFIQAFKEIGGQAELAKWAAEKKNRTAFYQMLARMLPNRLEGELEHSQPTKVVFEVVHSDGTQVKNDS